MFIFFAQNQDKSRFESNWVQNYTDNVLYTVNNNLIINFLLDFNYLIKKSTTQTKTRKINFLRLFLLHGSICFILFFFTKYYGYFYKNKKEPINNIKFFFAI